MQHRKMLILRSTFHSIIFRWVGEHKLVDYWLINYLFLKYFIFYGLFQLALYHSWLWQRIQIHDQRSYHLVCKRLMWSSHMFCDKKMKTICRGYLSTYLANIYSLSDSSLGALSLYHLFDILQWCMNLLWSQSKVVHDTFIRGKNTSL
jgi:hypothetical protein